MLPNWIKKLGKWRLLILGVIVSTGGSYLIAFILMMLITGEMNVIATLMSTLVPLLAGTPVFFFLSALQEVPL